MNLPFSRPSDPKFEIRPFLLKRSKKLNLGIKTRRALAFLTDLSLVTFLTKGFIASYISIFNSYVWLLKSPVKKALIQSGTQSFWLVGSFVFIGYFAGSHYMGNGKSVGKSIFGIRLTTHDYKGPELKLLLKRSLIYLAMVSFFPIFLVVPLFRKDHRSLGDWNKKTFVHLDSHVLYEQSLMPIKILGFQEAMASQLEIPFNVESLPTHSHWDHVSSEKNAA